MTTLESQPADTPAEIIANPDHTWSSYRMRRYAISIIIFLVGIWCIRDGFYVWPAENQRARQLKEEKLPHNNASLLINQVLGILLPPGSLVVLAWSLYKSRGRLLLRDHVLHVPGHPPVPLNAVIDLDDKDWDRKGIAWVKYRLPAGKAGTIKLDDFIYEREPTGAIFEVICEHLSRLMAENQPAIPPEQRPQALSHDKVSRRTKLVQKKRKPSSF